MKTMWLSVVLGLLGCGVDTQGLVGPHHEVCTPGEQRTCTCSESDEGVQTCNKEGTGLDKCQCDSGSGGGNAEGGGSSTSSGSGGSESAGGGGTGGSCTPLTFDEACTANGYDCGSVPDNCGGTVCCAVAGCENSSDANYCEDETQYCGLGNVAVDTQGRATGANNLPGTPNVCGGDCVLAEQQYQSQCPSAGSPFPENIHMYFCSRTDAFAVMPQDHGNCEHSGPISLGRWCCSN